MTFCDKRGLAVTAADQSAVNAFDAAVDSFLEYRLDMPEHIQSCLQADPGFALGHCMQAYMSQLAFTRYARKQATACLAATVALPTNPREQLHITALQAWLDGDRKRACTVWEAILVDYPHDLLALRLHHFNTFWLGRQYGLCRTSARLLPFWSDSMPGYGSLLGMYAFGLEECGEYAQAERIGREAVEYNKDDLWSVHAVAHVLESQGRMREGVEWLDYSLEEWADRGSLKTHIWWHQALFWIDLGEFDAALEAYDRRVRADSSYLFTDLQNAAALLARLEFQGVDVDQRWRRLAFDCAQRAQDYLLPFTRCHLVMALAREPQYHALVSELIAALEHDDDIARWEADAAQIGMPLCRAIAAYQRGAYDSAVDSLLPLRDELQRLGGSHAQRDVFTQFLLAAAIAAQRQPLVNTLLAERLVLRPNSVVARRRFQQMSAIHPIPKKVAQPA